MWKKFKKLKYLHIGCKSEIDSTFLFDLKQLQKIHLADREIVLKIFNQKQPDGRVKLKIYLAGLLLNGPQDPAINAFQNASNDEISYLAANPSRLADDIPSRKRLCYTPVEDVAPESRIGFLSRFTCLNQLIITRPVRDIERFLCSEELLQHFRVKILR